MKGVSVLALFALVGVGYNLRPEVDSESMRLKTDFELEALSDPLIEDLAQDLHRRVLSDYRDAKGLFSCNEDCQDKKHRVLLAERELGSIQRARAAARRAIRLRNQNPPNVAHVQASRQAERATAIAERKEFTSLNSAERASLRKLERQSAAADYRVQYPRLTQEEMEFNAASRRAERTAFIREYRNTHPKLTQEQKEANAAARLAQRNSERDAHRAANPPLTQDEIDRRQAALVVARAARQALLPTDEERHARWEANVRARQEEATRRYNAAYDARIAAALEYANSLAVAHGFIDWDDFQAFRSYSLEERAEYRKVMRGETRVVTRVNERREDRGNNYSYSYSTTYSSGADYSFSSGYDYTYSFYGE